MRLRIWLAFILGTLAMLSCANPPADWEFSWEAILLIPAIVCFLGIEIIGITWVSLTAVVVGILSSVGWLHEKWTGREEKSKRHEDENLS